MSTAREVWNTDIDDLKDQTNTGFKEVTDWLNLIHSQLEAIRTALENQ